MDDRRTALVVFLLRDPHLLESRERSKDGATDPDRVFALGRSNDLDLHGRRGQPSDLFLHAVGNSRIHCGSAGLSSAMHLFQACPFLDSVLTMTMLP